MLFFLHGPDTYRLREKLREIVEEYKKRHQSGLNFIRINFEEKDFQDFKQVIETVSMFDEKKLIIVEGAFQKSKDFQEELENYLERRKLAREKDVIIIFWAEEVESKNKPASPAGRLLQFLKKKAKVQSFELLKGYKLKNWIRDYVKKQKTDLENLALERLVEYVGNDLWRMSNELDKLISFKKQTIKEEDIRKLVEPEVDVNIFDTIDALGQRNKKQALKLVYSHFKKGESEGYLLDRFVYQFRNLLKIKSFLQTNPDVRNDYLIAKNLGMHPYVVKKSIIQAENFSFEDLKKIYRKLLAIDLDIKTGRTNAKTALEMFVVNL